MVNQLTAFWQRQYEQIRSGGAAVLLQKLGRVLFNIVLLIPASMSVLVIAVLKPFVTVRFGMLDIARIGGVYGADWYLTQYKQGMIGRRCFDFFYFDALNNVISNHQWYAMWSRVIRVFPYWPLARMIHRLLTMIFKDKKHTIPLLSTTGLMVESFKQESPILEKIYSYDQPHISFTEEEEKYGQEQLRALGVPEGVTFICFHVRDSAYLDAMHPNRNWSYHDYRDSSIHHCIPAVEKLTEQGYYAIRMGAIVKEKLDTDNERIIDYAHHAVRSDFMDIYLGAKCRFFITSDCGISIIPEVFRKPVVYLNWTLFERISPWVFDGLFTFKKYYLPKEDRLLSFAEIVDLKMGSSGVEQAFKDRGIELIENTPEEIMSVVEEMERRVAGTWSVSEEDVELQAQFWRIFGESKLRNQYVHVGKQFLDDHKHLINASSLS